MPDQASLNIMYCSREKLKLCTICKIKSKHRGYTDGIEWSLYKLNMFTGAVKILNGVYRTNGKSVQK